MERWRGRVALVTGASSGIGAAIARRLVQHSLIVVACARNVDKIQTMKEELIKSGAAGQLRPVYCDLRQEADILGMFQLIRNEFGRVDICVNNAGLTFQTGLLDATTEQWRNMLDVNILALCICTREAVKLMREKGIDDGHIIHISSMSGYRLTTRDLNFYSCTKHAVKALTEGLRRELNEAKTHIRVSSISPGNVTTPLTAASDPGFQELDVDDISDAVVYILSTKSHTQVHDILIRPVEQPT